MVESSRRTRYFPFSITYRLLQLSRLDQAARSIVRGATARRHGRAQTHSITVWQYGTTGDEWSLGHTAHARGCLAVRSSLLRMRVGRNSTLNPLSAPARASRSSQGQQGWTHCLPRPASGQPRANTEPGATHTCMTTGTGTGTGTGTQLTGHSLRIADHVARTRSPPRNPRVAARGTHLR